MDERPDLGAAFDIFGVEATVTLPGVVPPVVTRVMELEPFNERFPADSGNWSLTKKRRRFAVRLQQLGVTEVLIGTRIAMASETVKVEATDYIDQEVAYVLVR